MFTTLLGLPALLITIGALIGGAVVGFFYVAGVWGKAKSEDIKEAKDASEYVINTLKEKIEILEKKTSNAEEERENINKRLDALQMENKTLREILQGKDAETQRFQQEGFRSIQQAAKAITNIEVIEDRVNKILDIIEHREVVVTKIHKDIQASLDEAKN